MQKRYNLRFARLRYICLTANAEAIKIPPTPAGISSSKFKTQFYISRKAENTACVLTSPLPTKAVRLCGDPKSGISHAVGVYRKFRKEFISLQPSAARSGAHFPGSFLATAERFCSQVWPPPRDFGVGEGCKLSLYFVYAEAYKTHGYTKRSGAQL